MQVHHLGQKTSLLHHFLSEIRDITIQDDRMRFRRNIERIGEVLSMELSSTLPYSAKTITTPLGQKKTYTLTDEIIVCSILRAGLNLHQGILNYFDRADSSFVSAYRKHTTDQDFEIKVQYMATQDFTDKILILADPMLATGRSLLAAYKALRSQGKPKEIHILSVIGAQPGIDFLERNFPKDTHLWIADIDPELNEKGYIVPGLGDAGDLAYGQKL
ncbi:uracil phosphoribosyltransferase [Galbibacter sp.]|uniref:uracil phosphoribosyltransferase n=1 Tax=Galbibacter sp. TaxID=2918471 RepID=UPI002C6220F5|nr:uracil phosphoribosyltransferase [Galbibacter sp.]HLV63038.1 uracil phosphoribosyltransferase [Galbibacter sp.]